MDASSFLKARCPSDIKYNVGAPRQDRPAVDWEAVRPAIAFRVAREHCAQMYSIGLGRTD